ncbi:hypothetical protein BDY19DRAFT_901777 [Irpex rosettiformis]|uniref:Uncharacterized protein n=1 Tax=Irpex rosettiformis TaxID=378272 RepID=A0ACB8UJU3_9APHY|nr:hypothetical protein BDY19DRAFT_901777 [Irpex rosettiformis]
MTLSERDLQSWLFRTIVDRDDEIKQFRKVLESVQQQWSVKLTESQELVLQEQLHKQRSQEKSIELEARLNVSAQTELRMRAELSELHGQARTMPSLRASLEATQRQLDAKGRECVQYEETIRKLNYQYEDNAMTKARIQELEQKLNEAEKRLGEYETNLQSDTHRLLNAMAERDQAQTALEASNGQILNTKQRMQVLEKDNSNLTQSLVNLEGQVRNKVQQVLDVQKELEATKSRELELAAKCAALQSQPTRQMTSLRERFNAMEKRTSTHPVLDTASSATVSSAQQPIIQATASQPSETSVSAPKLLVLRLPARASPLGSQQLGPTASQAGPTTSQQPPSVPATIPTAPRLSQPLPYNCIPVARRQVLQAFPPIDVPDWATGEITFSRAELTALLGGGLQGVDGKFGTPRRVAAAHGLTGCIYPQRQTNPWLPILPGQHGYMFLGLEGPAKDNVKFFEPTERALFIQEGPNSWRYYGLYVIQRHANNDLEKEEWMQFDESFKDGKGSYSDTTLAKQLGKGYDALVKNHLSDYRQRTTEIRGEYDAGTRRVPCITLQCIGYNVQFFQDIVACRPSDRPLVKRKRTPKMFPDGTPSPSRPRLE